MKKIDLTGVSSAPKTAKAKHPVVTVDDATNALCTQFLDVAPRAKQLEEQRKTLSGQIGDRIKRLFFTRNHGVTPESSTMIVNVVVETENGPVTKSLNLTTQNRYSTKLEDDAPLRVAIGDELTDRYFEYTTRFATDFDKMPEAKRDPFAQAVIKLAQEHGVAEAIVASQFIQPKPGFHETRTRVLTPEQNLAVDEILPITAFPKL